MVCDQESARLFAAAIEHLHEAGVKVETVPFAPFLELASLLYKGAFVAERLVATADLLARNPAAINPVVRGILEAPINIPRSTPSKPNIAAPNSRALSTKPWPASMAWWCPPRPASTPSKPCWPTRWC